MEFQINPMPQQQNMNRGFGGVGPQGWDGTQNTGPGQTGGNDDVGGGYGSRRDRTARTARSKWGGMTSREKQETIEGLGYDPDKVGWHDETDASYGGYNPGGFEPGRTGAGSHRGPANTGDAFYSPEHGGNYGIQTNSADTGYGDGWSPAAYGGYDPKGIEEGRIGPGSHRGPDNDPDGSNRFQSGLFAGGSASSGSSSVNETRFLGPGDPLVSGDPGGNGGGTEEDTETPGPGTTTTTTGDGTTTTGGGGGGSYASRPLSWSGSNPLYGPGGAVLAVNRHGATGRTRAERLRVSVA